MDTETLAREAAEAMGFRVDLSDDTFEYNPFGGMLTSIQHSCTDLLTDPAWGLPMIRRIVEMIAERDHISMEFHASLTWLHAQPSGGSPITVEEDDDNHDLVAIATALVKAFRASQEPAE